MNEDKIILTLQKLSKIKEELKEVKKELKQEEKITDEEYETMKKTAKELHGQLKDFEENWKRELLNDEAYQKLRELKIQKEEEVAEEIAKLYQLVEKLPPKMWETKIETEEGQIRLQIQPEMKVYLNGKEEKRRA